MHRTQVYLSNEEKLALDKLTAQTNRSKAYFILKALDQYLDQLEKVNFESLLLQTRGIFFSEGDRQEWKQRERRFDE